MKDAETSSGSVDILVLSASLVYSRTRDSNVIKVDRTAQTLGVKALIRPAQRFPFTCICVFGSTLSVEALSPAGGRLARNGVRGDWRPSNTPRDHFLRADFWPGFAELQPGAGRAPPTGSLTSEWFVIRDGNFGLPDPRFENLRTFDWFG